MTMKEGQRAKNLHLQCSTAVDMVIKTALHRKSLDNVTCVLIAFENLEKFFNKNSEYETLEKSQFDKSRSVFENIGSFGNTNYKFSYNDHNKESLLLSTKGYNKEPIKKYKFFNLDHIHLYS
jgi:hypothetical protein